MRPETKALYPANWAAISKACIEAADHICQECGRSDRDSPVILTSHHKDYDPSNNTDDNLVCLCQGCHLARQAKDLTEARRFMNIIRLTLMGQTMLPGFDIEVPTNLARVVEGKALATGPAKRRRARRDT